MLQFVVIKDFFVPDLFLLPICYMFFDILLTVISDKFTIELNFEHVIFFPISLQ